MVERCLRAGRKIGISADIIDLRSLIPWDRHDGIVLYQKHP